MLVSGIVWTCMRGDGWAAFSTLQCVLMMKIDLGFIWRN